MKPMSPEIEAHLLDVIDSQKVAVLTTLGKDFPYSCLVSFDVSRDLKHLFFATKRKRQKYDNIMNDSRVAVIIDDRNNRDFDLHNTTVISIAGIAQDYAGTDANQYLDALEAKYPYLHQFLRSEDTALIRIDIETLYIVDDFERVRRFE